MFGIQEPAKIRFIAVPSACSRKRLEVPELPNALSFDAASERDNKDLGPIQNSFAAVNDITAAVDHEFRPAEDSLRRSAEIVAEHICRYQVPSVHWPSSLV